MNAASSSDNPELIREISELKRIVSSWPNREVNSNKQWHVVFVEILPTLQISALSYKSPMLLMSMLWEDTDLLDPGMTDLSSMSKGGEVNLSNLTLHLLPRSC